MFAFDMMESAHSITAFTHQSFLDQPVIHFLNPHKNNYMN